VIARVVVLPRPEVADPQGTTVARALTQLGFAEVRSVRVGKYMEVELDASAEEASGRIEEMCRTLLANPVIEDYRFRLEEATPQQ
jgi:phosphoribosylformylglycinamidine synthase PurS subunit